MAAHRYWRATNLRAYNGGSTVELSEFQLFFAGVRVDSGATLTSSVAPIAGSLANLRDASTATDCSLSTASVLNWDFGGSPSDVDDIRLGTTDNLGRFLRLCIIQWSDDNTNWTTFGWNDAVQQPGAFARPAERSLTGTRDPREWDSGALLAYVKDPTDGRIVSLSGSFSRYARAEAYASSGVKQFEITRSAWNSVWRVGVYSILESPLAVSDVNGWTFRLVDGTKNELNSGSTSYPTGGWTASDVFGCVINFNTGQLTVYKNGVSLGVAFTSLAGQIVRPGITADNTGETATLRTNNFTYPIAGAEPWTKAQITAGISATPIQPVVITNGGYDEPFTGVVYPALERARPDYNFDPAARGRIVGTVARDADPANIPLRRRVRLYRDRDGLFIRETWSDAAGNYEFNYIEENEAYTVIANDYEFFYRAVVADNLTLANGGVELI